MPRRIPSFATTIARLADNRPLLVISALLLGLSIQVRDGLFDPKAMYLLTASLVLCAFVVCRRGISSQQETSTIPRVIAIAIAVELVTIVLAQPSKVGIPVMNAIVGAVTLAAFAFNRRFGGFVVIVGFAAIGWKTIHRSPNPYIDTFIQNRDSCDALIHGVNPYTISFPDIYEGNSFTYPAGMVHEGRVWMGYPYPPLPLFLQTPAHLICGDFRYAQLIAMILSGVILISLGRLGALTAALLLFTPRAFYVLEMGWIEPFLILFLTASVWCAMRKPKWLPIPLGLFFASKQHLFLCAPLVLLLVEDRRAAIKLLLKSFAIAAVVSLPVILWNPRAFFENTILLQLRLPFRDDSSSYLAWIAQRGGPKLPAVCGFATMAIAMGISLWKLPRSAGHFTLAAGFSFFALFAFNKQAFCNYYFLVIAMMCCAIAAIKSEDDLPQMGHG